jgi:exodeoxyribonuclease VII large subunit
VQPRLPFDPERMAVKRERQANDAPLRVAELADRVSAALASGLPATVRVRGEVSNLSRRTHWYFDLKDARAIVRCVMFASAAGAGSAHLRDGVEVVATARVEFYAPQGRLSLVVTRVEPAGEGALDRAFRALCAELRALGWFDPERKRPIPVFPGRIGVVTSAGGAALQDVLDTMRRRCPAVEIALVDVRVQGEGAAEEIARAVRRLGAEHEALAIDAILVTRGGGSIEDLWAFNERIVAEAIVTCPVPVVAAIGHETDVTIAELVADERGATPTQAAMRLAPDRAALREQAEMAGRRLGSALARRTAQARQRLESASRHPQIASPRGRLRALARECEAAARRLGAAESARIVAALRRLHAAEQVLSKHAPVAIRARQARRVDAAAARLALAARKRLLQPRLDVARDGLRRSFAAGVGSARERIESCAGRLSAVGPASVLARGYSVTIGPDGRVVRSVRQVAPGDRLVTRVADGREGAR